MKRRRRILAAIILLAAVCAVTAVVMPNLGGLPPDLAKRLPPRESIPATLTPEQRQAVELAYSRSAADRARATSEIRRANVPDKVAIPYLLALLADHSKGEWSLTNTATIRAILGKPKDWRSDLTVADQAQEVLMGMGQTEFPAICRAVKEDPDPGARMRLVIVLLLCGEPGTLEVLLDVAGRDPHEQVRETVLMNLGSRSNLLQGDRPAAGDRPQDRTGSDGRAMAVVGGGRFLEMLTAIMKDDTSAANRVTAASVLAPYLPEEARPCLISAARSKDATIRWTAVQGLEKLGKSPDVIEAVLATLEYQDATATAKTAEFVRACAAETLKKLTGQNFGKDPAQWRAWYEEHKAEFSGPARQEPESKNP